MPAPKPCPRTRGLPVAPRISRRRRAGQVAAVEMAFILPLFILLIVGIMETGRAYYVKSLLANAAREGAHYAASHPTDTDGIEQETKNYIAGVAAEDLTITVSYPDDTSNSGDRVRVTIKATFRTLIPSLVLENYTLTETSTMRIE